MPKKKPAAKTTPGKQTTLRIPGFLWKRIEDAMEFEGSDAFSSFALNSLTRNCRRIEIEKKREQAGLPAVPGT